MGFVAMILAVAAGIGVWMYRARAATDAARGALDVADDVRAAIRRFGYRRKKLEATHSTGSRTHACPPPVDV